jgi:hypothetical protein
METFALKYPFEYRGTTYDSIRVRRPKVRDLRMFVKDIDKDPINAMEKVIGNLAELDDKVIAELDIEDFGPIKAWFEAFLKPIADASNE